MSIELTPRAAEEIRRVVADQGLDPAETALRVDVQPRRPGAPGSGFILDLTATWSEAEDVVLESQGLRIVCHKDSFGRLKGTRIDFRDEPSGRGFAFDRPAVQRDATEAQQAPPPDEATVREALHHVIDPEIGINIVDLGLVYGIDIHDRTVKLTLTMTTPACPLSEHIKQEAKHCVLGHCPGAATVETHLVWDPPWAAHMMSEQAKRQMGWSRT